MASLKTHDNGNGIDHREMSGGMLTVNQVAEMLNAHPNSVRRWADMGLLDSYRIGLRGDRRFKREDVSGFMVPQNRSVAFRSNSLSD